MSLVSLTDVRKSGKVKTAIDESLQLIGYKFARDTKEVVIKPNMCYYWDYSTGETTDPEFVGALIDLIRTQVSPNVQISVVEADASAMKCKYAFKFLGYEKMAKKKGVNLVNLSEEKNERVEVSVDGHRFLFKIPQIIQNADLKVNVPKIKYHPLTKISCALKNIYGCNPYPKKFKYHSRINEVIVALNKAMIFDLCIVDGIIAFGSQPSNLGLVLAGLDQVAVDATAATLAGINPRVVQYIMLASKEGLGNASFLTKGVSIEYFKKLFPRKNVTSEIMRIGLKTVSMLRLNRRLGLIN